MAEKNSFLVLPPPYDQDLFRIAQVPQRNGHVPQVNTGRDHHQNSGYFYQAELLIKAISRNYRYAEVPYMQKPRVHGRSKSITIRALASAMKGYAVMVHEFYFRRSDTFTVEPASITARKQGDI